MHDQHVITGQSKLKELQYEPKRNKTIKRRKLERHRNEQTKRQGNKQSLKVPKLAVRKQVQNTHALDIWSINSW